MTISGLTGFGSTAQAQSCLSTNEARAAVQANQVRPLSALLPAIRAAVGGEVLPGPQLCRAGSQLFYLVNVMSDGRIAKLEVDAQTGQVRRR